MKKETFVYIMDTLESYKQKCTKFGKAVANAFIEADAESDFTQPTSYEIPYGKLFDGIVQAISFDLADENYTQEMVEDFINWWMWECEFGKAKPIVGWLDNVDPCQVTLCNGKTFKVKSASKLYDVIMLDKKIKR